MELLKLLSANEIVAQVISFLILLFLLRIFAWKKFLKVLDDRRERIAAELRRIDDAKREVLSLRTDYEQRLGAIEQTAKAKIDEALEAGKRYAGQMRVKADEDRKRTVEDAKEAIKTEVANAREELKEEIVNLSIDIAGKVLEEKLTSRDDKRLAEEFLKELGPSR